MTRPVGGSEVNLHLARFNGHDDERVIPMQPFYWEIPSTLAGPASARQRSTNVYIPVTRVYCSLAEGDIKWDASYPNVTMR